MISITELIIVLLFVACATVYIIYSILIPSFRKKASNSKPGCSDDCGCEAKDKIAEFTKGKV